MAQATFLIAPVISPVAPVCACVPRIDNPKYKGIWVAPDIDNPDFKDDPKLYLQKDIKYIGFELWQVGVSGVCPGGVWGPACWGCWEEPPSKRLLRCAG